MTAAAPSGLPHARLALLELLPEPMRTDTLKRLQPRSYNRRELVIKRNEVAPGLLFLMSGRLQGVDFTVDGREAGLYFVNPGEYFGELAVIDGQSSPEFVMAVIRSDVALLPLAEARRLLFSSPGLAERVALGLTARIRELTWQRTVLALATPLQRVCALLLHLCAVGGQTEVIANVPTHQELAIMVNTSRETVSRIFQSLQTQKIIVRSGSDLRILNAPLLNEFAKGLRDSR